jgi:hypothetical protein
MVLNGVEVSGAAAIGVVASGAVQTGVAQTGAVIIRTVHQAVVISEHRFFFLEQLCFENDRAV